MSLSSKLFFEFAHKTLKFQDNQKRVRKNEDKSKRVSEMHFPPIWRPKFQK